MTMTCSNKKLYIDIETYSGADLRVSGVYKYAQSSDFEVLLFAYAYDDDPVCVLDLAKGQEVPEYVIQDLSDPNVIKIAHNASFERICLSYAFDDGKFYDPKGWYCTMVHSTMCGLPSSLDQVGKALGLSEDKRKLAFGKSLIRYFCQPCKPTKANGMRTRNKPDDDQAKWEEFVRYNMRDVETEREIESALNGIYTMPEKELMRYWKDQKINDRGILVDMDLVRIITDFSQAYTRKLLQRAYEISGVNIKSVVQLSAWIGSKTGTVPASLSKESVEQLEKEITDPDVLKVLRLRKELSKSSVKKYDVFLNAVTDDNRIHGCFQFYGSRTGRWAGRLLQPQNLPRNSFNDIERARDLVKDQDWETLEMFYGSINDVFSTLIRTMLIAPEQFAVADYSAIEARVIAWLADETWRLEAFRQGRDIYCESASMMFGVPVEKHGANGHLRSKGKVAELACGYGGAVGAMKAMGAEKMGLSEDEIADIVRRWRAKSPKIVKLWSTVESLVKAALQSKNEWISGLCGKLHVNANGKQLFIKLPSGRCLVYQNPRYEQEDGYGIRLCFDGMDQTTRQWRTVSTWGGKLTENIIQAIARDCLAELLDRTDGVVMHVHDEIVSESDNLNNILKHMKAPIDWAPGLPLKGAGFVCQYYQKD